MSKAYVVRNNLTGSEYEIFGDNENCILRQVEKNAEIKGNL